MAVIAAFVSCLGCAKAETVVSEAPQESPSAVQLTVADVSDANVALEEGKRLLDENQTEKAIEFLQHSVVLNPDLAEGHFNLGIAFALLELQYEQEGVIAESESNTNTNRKGERPKTKSERSFERAVAAYEKWLDKNPQDDAAYFNLGRTFSKLMKDEEAEKAFRQAVKLKPEDSEYQTELGGILVKLAQYHQAIEPLKEAVKLDPENVRAQELLEDAQAGRQRLDFVSPKQDSNKATSNRPSGTSSKPDANTASNSNASPRGTDADTKPRPVSTLKPTPAANRP